jgi:hypothetical protein
MFDNSWLLIEHFSVPFPSPEYVWKLDRPRLRQPWAGNSRTFVTSFSEFCDLSKAMPNNQILNYSLRSNENIEKAIGDITLMKQRCENDDRMYSHFKPYARSRFFIQCLVQQPHENCLPWSCRFTQHENDFRNNIHKNIFHKYRFMSPSLVQGW